MRLEKIENEELKRQIALRAGKLSFNDVTEEDLDYITELTLSMKSMSGEKNEIDFSTLELFPALRKVRVIGFDINQNEIDIVSRLDWLETLEFSKCKFGEVSFKEIEEKLKRIDFSECGELVFEYPKVKNILINQCSVDFSRISLVGVQNIYVLESMIKNLPDLKEYPELRKVNLDGTTVLDENGAEVKEVVVSDTTELSHKDHVEKIDKNRIVDKKEANNNGNIKVKTEDDDQNCLTF